METLTTSKQHVDKAQPLVHVALYLRGHMLNPDQVSLMLGTNGTKMRRKGEKWRTSTDHEVTAKIGFWMLDAKAESFSLSAQISWLREKLKSATCTPLRIPGVEEAEVDVFIALAENGRGGGDYASQLTADDLAWLSSFGVSVSFTLTYVEDGTHES